VSKQTEKSQVGPIQTFPNSKTVKLFPAVFVTEGQTAAYFATELSAYLDIEPDGQQQNQVKSKYYSFFINYGRSETISQSYSCLYHFLIINLFNEFQ